MPLDVLRRLNLTKKRADAVAKRERLASLNFTNLEIWVPPVEVSIDNVQVFAKARVGLEHA